MFEQLPPEIVAKIIAEIFAIDRLAIGSLCLVCKEWNNLFNQAFIWMTIGMEFHKDFYTQLRDTVNMYETIQTWNDPSQKEEQEIIIDWKSKVIEWEFIDEIISCSKYFFEEPYERRLLTADHVETLCKSQFISINTLTELTSSIRSDLKVSAGIGLKSKFIQLCDSYPKYFNSNYNFQKEEEIDYEQFSGISEIRKKLAINSCGFNESLNIVGECFDLILMAIDLKEDPKNIQFPRLFQNLIDVLYLLLDDPASRVSYRGIEAISYCKPLCFYFYDKILYVAEHHYNPAVNGIATDIIKSLK